MEEIFGSGILLQISVKTLSYPVSRVHDCHTRTFCSLYCAPYYDYGFNNKKC